MFRTKRGMRIHAGKCKCKDLYEVERILDCRGETMSREYLVRWKDYPPEEDQWLGRTRIAPQLIRDYELTNGKYDYEWQFRCQFCDKPCRSKQGVKVHYAVKYKKRERKQEFAGRVAQRLHTEAVLEERQAAEQKINCDKHKLKN